MREIPNKPKMTKIEEVIEGLQIISQYDPDAHMATDYETLYAGSQTAMLKAPQSVRQRLDELGWFPSSEVDAWAKFL